MPESSPLAPGELCFYFAQLVGQAFLHMFERTALCPSNKPEIYIEVILVPADIGNITRFAQLMDGCG